MDGVSAPLTTVVGALTWKSQLIKKVKEDLQDFYWPKKPCFDNPIMKFETDEDFNFVFLLKDGTRSRKMNDNEDCDDYLHHELNDPDSVG